MTFIMKVILSRKDRRKKLSAQLDSNPQPHDHKASALLLRYNL